MNTGNSRTKCFNKPELISLRFNPYKVIKNKNLTPTLSKNWYSDIDKKRFIPTKLSKHASRKRRNLQRPIQFCIFVTIKEIECLGKKP